MSASPYIDGTTYKIAFDEDQLFTLFEDRPESLIANLAFGDPNQDEDDDAVIAAQRELSSTRFEAHDHGLHQAHRQARHER